jgi:hypothetical protein
MLVATRGGPTMFARIGVMQALNRGHARPETEKPALGKTEAEEGRMKG